MDQSNISDVEEKKSVGPVNLVSSSANISNVEEKKSVGPLNLVLTSADISTVNNSNNNTIVDGSNGFTDAALIPLNYYKKDFKLLNYYINKKFDSSNM
jgi:hypothetical protein